MDITAKYAHYLYGNNLTNTSIKNYLSDINQYLLWKDKFAPNQLISEELIQQYLRTSSLTRSIYTIRRKEVSLNKFLDWIKQDSLVAPIKRAEAKQQNKYPLVAATFILLLMSFALVTSTPKYFGDTDTESEYATIKQDVATAVTDETLTDVEGIEVAVSGYDIQTPVSDSAADILITLQSTLSEKTDQDSFRSLSPTGGTEQIEQGNTYTIIIDKYITADSIITITPSASTEGQSLFIQAVKDGYAVVAIEKPITKPLPFNWIAIKTNQFPTVSQ